MGGGGWEAGGSGLHAALPATPRSLPTTACQQLLVVTYGVSPLCSSRLPRLQSFASPRGGLGERTARGCRLPVKLCDSETHAAVAPWPPTQGLFNVKFVVLTGLGSVAIICVGVLCPLLLAHTVTLIMITRPRSRQPKGAPFVSARRRTLRTSWRAWGAPLPCRTWFAGRTAMYVPVSTVTNTALAHAAQASVSPIIVMKSSESRTYGALLCFAFIAFPSETHT